MINPRRLHCVVIFFVTTKTPSFLTCMWLLHIQIVLQVIFANLRLYYRNTLRKVNVSNFSLFWVCYFIFFRDSVLVVITFDIHLKKKDRSKVSCLCKWNARKQRNINRPNIEVLGISNWIAIVRNKRKIMQIALISCQKANATCSRIIH